MDIDETDALSLTSNQHHHNYQQQQFSPRPVIPPKPKSSGNVKKEPNSPGEKRTEVATSTVGTQVNLLAKRRSRESGREDLPNSDERIIVANSKTEIVVGEELKSPLVSLSKPAIPPKPSPSTITTPKKSISIPSASIESVSGDGELPLSSNSPLKPPIRKTRAPYASIDELDDLSNGDKPTNVQSKGSYLVNPAGTRTHPRRDDIFQYPGEFSPSSGLSHSQRIQAQRKSTSLGRNTICPTSTNLFTPPPHTFACVSHLDLTSSSKLVRRMVFDSGSPSKVAPPPPPRRRNSHKPLATPTVDIALTHQSHQSAPVTPSTPFYAVVDKEKKWEMRRLKEEMERLNNNIFIPDNTDGTGLKEEMSSEEVRIQDSTSPVPIGDTSHEDSLPLEEPFSPEPLSPCDETNSWLVKFLAQKPEHGLPVQNQDFIVSDPSIENKDSSPVENSSFLFSHLNNISFQSESGEILGPGDENDVKMEDEGGVNEEIDHLTPPDSNHPEDDDQKNLSDTTTSAKEENEESMLVSSQNCQELESKVMDGGTVDSGDSTREGTEKAQSLEEDVFECLLEQKLEPVLLLTGVTEAETATEDVAGKVAAPSDADLISEIVRSQEQFKSPTRKPEIVNGDEDGTKKGEEYTRTAVLPPLISVGSFRRRSWTCSENTFTSFTESSPSSSSSSSLRERTRSISGSINSHITWVDEGELSTGALGDAENSDACQGGSIEDFSPPINVRSPGPGSFSRRRRLVSSFFASFGKGGGGSSSSNQSGVKKVTGIRLPPPGRRKEKSQSHFFLEATQPHQKGKKAKSEIYLTRGTAVKVHLDKQFSSPSQLGSKDRTEFPGEVNKSRPSSQIVVETGPVPNPMESGDTASISSRCYDDILSELGHKERQAFYVAREILTSERTFVDVLNLLTIDFPTFLKAAEARLGHVVISRGDLDFILGGLPNLKLVNQSLLHELEERIGSWKSNPKVSDIVIKTGPFLKHYSTYIRDYQKISIRFEQIREKSPYFARTVAEFEKLEKCRNLQLKHYMLKPVQRMPQYALLLGDYLKNLDEEENEDYRDTVRAISIVKEVAEHGNEAIRLQENAEKLVHLQNRLTQNVILKADRQLICEGELRKICRKGLQPRYFALMSDCLLCMNYAGSGTATGSKEFKLTYELPLTGMRVALATNEDYQNEFSVISVTRSFSLVAKTPKERNDWLKALNLAIKNNIKKRAGTAQEIEQEVTEIGKVAPVWIADARVTMCQSCTAEFTITFRRHHCRACGKVFCGNCSGNDAPLQYLNYEAARVCDDCYTHLMEEFDQENHENSQEDVDIVRGRFKKGTPSISKRATKHKKSIPNRLEIHGNISGSAMSGYLNWKETRKGWKRQWFVLIDRVLYVYAASEDIAAIRGIPILGYQVELMSGGEGVDGDEGGKSIFQLTHSGQEPYIFQAESSSTEKWIAAMKEATVLK